MTQLIGRTNLPERLHTLFAVHSTLRLKQAATILDGPLKKYARHVSIDRKNKSGQFHTLFAVHQ